MKAAAYNQRMIDEGVGLYQIKTRYLRRYYKIKTKSRHVIERDNRYIDPVYRVPRHTE